MTTWTAKKVRELRNRRGESQEEFAKHFRLTVDSIRTWEQDKGNPSGAATVILDQLAGVIGVSVANFAQARLAGVK